MEAVRKKMNSRNEIEIHHIPQSSALENTDREKNSDSEKSRRRSGLSGFKRNEEKKKITLNEEFIFFFPVAHAEALFFHTETRTVAIYPCLTLKQSNSLGVRHPQRTQC